MALGEDWEGKGGGECLRGLGGGETGFKYIT